MGEVDFAHDRATTEMLNAAVAVAPSGQAVSIVDMLCMMGMPRDQAVHILTGVTSVYHNEMLASWKARFEPLPLLPQKLPTMMERLWANPFVRGSVASFAIIGVLTFLRALLKVIQ